VIFPGAVATDITGNSGVVVPNMDSVDQSKIRTTTPEDAAKIILDGIESDELHIYVGRDSKTMNLMTRVAPRRATHLIYKQMKDLLG
jgi:short-subunit dehydrogenase